MWYFIFFQAFAPGGAQIVIQQQEKNTIGPCVLQLFAKCDSEFLTFKLHNKFLNDTFRRLNVTAPDGGDGFDPALPMKMIVHGYGGAFDMYNPSGKITTAYLEQHDLNVNVIIVDWTLLSNTPCYPVAVINTWHVGKCIAEFLDAMEFYYPAFRSSETHVVGFSLGAHVAGYASEKLYARKGFKLARITGLDPALPLFKTMSDTWKLDAGDATFVDVIHTNVGILGKVESTGHADFYVNGGTTQRGCKGHKNPSLCSHLLAPIYFAESIGSPKGFWGVSCPNYYQYVLGWCPENENTKLQRVPMGEKCSPGTLGVYLVTTGDSPPYALG